MWKILFLGGIMKYSFTISKEDFLVFDFLKNDLKKEKVKLTFKNNKKKYT